jgi:hypothetical protein
MWEPQLLVTLRASTACRGKTLLTQRCAYMICDGNLHPKKLDSITVKIHLLILFVFNFQTLKRALLTFCSVMDEKFYVAE